MLIHTTLVPGERLPGVGRRGSGVLGEGEVMPPGYGSWLLRLLVGWLLMVPVVSHVKAAEVEGPGEVAVIDAVDQGGENGPVEDGREEVRERGWIHNNLVVADTAEVQVARSTWCTNSLAAYLATMAAPSAVTTTASGFPWLTIRTCAVAGCGAANATTTQARGNTAAQPGRAVPERPSDSWDIVLPREEGPGGRA